MRDDGHKVIYKNTAIKDHHLSRTGRRESIDKKQGAGKNNWGTVEDLEKAESIDFFASSK